METAGETQALLQDSTNYETTTRKPHKHRTASVSSTTSSIYQCAEDHRITSGAVTREANRNKRRLWMATALSVLFFVLELVAGLWSRSLALLSDSFHLLSDVAGFIISLVALYLAQMPATKRHSFGFHRAEILGTMLSVFLIWVLTAILVYEAIERIKKPEPIDANIMLITAAVGVVVNIILGVVLGHEHDHDHDHEEGEHDHSHTHHKKEANPLLTSAAIHVLGDLISSVGVLISAIIIKVDPTKVIVDPICTFIFSVIVLFTTFRLVGKSISVLMEATPSHLDPELIEADLAEIPGVAAVHDLHVWTLTVGKPALAVHLTINPIRTLPQSDSTPENSQVHRAITVYDYNHILSDAQRLICRKYNIHHSTIQLEMADLTEMFGDDARLSDVMGMPLSPGSALTAPVFYSSSDGHVQPPSGKLKQFKGHCRNDPQ